MLSNVSSTSGSFSFRVIYVDKSAVVARLEVERVGYRNKRVMVKVVTQELPGPGPDIIAGLRVYHALDGADFNTYFSELTFVPGQVSVKNIEKRG